MVADPNEYDSLRNALALMLTQTLCDIETGDLRDIRDADGLLIHIFDCYDDAVEFERERGAL